MTSACTCTATMAMCPTRCSTSCWARFGDKGVVDIIGINGYYDAVAMTINAANGPMPPGVKPPLD